MPDPKPTIDKSQEYLSKKIGTSSKAKPVVHDLENNELRLSRMILNRVILIEAFALSIGGFLVWDGAVDGGQYFTVVAVILTIQSQLSGYISKMISPNSNGNGNGK